MVAQIAVYVKVFPTFTLFDATSLSRRTANPLGGKTMSERSLLLLVDAIINMLLGFLGMEKKDPRDGPRRRPRPHLRA